MIRVSELLAAALQEARRKRSTPGGIYLTRERTDALLEELGQKRDGRCTKRPAVSEFNGVPVYPDRDIGMVVCHDTDGEAWTILL